MAEKLARLTQKQVEHAAPPGNGKSILLADGGNLYLEATRSNDGSVNRSWIFRYQYGFKPDGKPRRHDLGLGPLHTFGLADARRRALELRQQIKLGNDPFESRRQAKRERLARRAEAAKAVTFKQTAEMYLNVHADRWRNEKHRAQWRSTLETYAYPIVGDLAVADVDETHLLKILQPIWKRVPETASRLRARMENVLGYAIASKFRQGDNPARWRGHLKTLLGGARKEEQHHPAVPFLEAPAFMVDLRDRDSTSARALEFLLLTAARTSEVLGARWEEIDLNGKEWRVPSSRMKAQVEHRVPFSDRAASLLQALPRGGPFLFAGAKGKPLSNMALLELLRGMRPGATVHGFRSTFRDWAAERTSYPNHVVEKALAHKIPDKVEAAYRRGELLDKRRKLMEQWERFLATPLPAESGSVVSIRQG